MRASKGTTVKEKGCITAACVCVTLSARYRREGCIDTRKHGWIAVFVRAHTHTAACRCVGGGEGGLQTHGCLMKRAHPL